MPKTQSRTKAAESAVAGSKSKKAQPKKNAKTAKKPIAKAAPPKKPVNKKPVNKKPASKKPASKKSTTAAQKAKAAKSKLSKEFLKSQLQKLNEEREKYMNTAEQLEEEAESLLDYREATNIQMTDDSGEGDTTSYYRELDLTISAQSREVVEQIDEAIVRIKNGTYGICVDTGKSIPKKRLEAIPWASQTIEAKAGGLRRR